MNIKKLTKIIKKKCNTNNVEQLNKDAVDLVKNMMRKSLEIEEEERRQTEIYEEHIIKALTQVEK